MSTTSKDKENRRKCFKCNKSPVTDNIKLFRFPKPAVRNLLRCTLWAKFMFPFEESQYTSIKFQTMLFNEHRMLCQDHFLEGDFTDDTKQKMLRHAVPYMAEDVGTAQPFYDASMPGPSQQPTHAIARTSGEAILKDIGNTSEAHIAEDSQIKEAEELPAESKCKTKKEKELYIKCAKYMRKLCQLKNRTKTLQKKSDLEQAYRKQCILKVIENINAYFFSIIAGPNKK